MTFGLTVSCSTKPQRGVLDSVYGFEQLLDKPSYGRLWSGRSTPAQCGRIRIGGKSVGRLWEIQESALVNSGREDLYAAISRVRNIGSWSPECFAVWHRGPVAGAGARFVGFNRRGLFVWFTTCRVVVADAPAEFAFKVTTFGLPVALWGYRLEPEGAGTRVTEYWRDLRTGPGARLTELLGRVFTGTRPTDRAEVNRAGMRSTLQRIKTAVEA
ncbi:SRPBCC family protein [Streptomyces sp. NPDC002499]